MTESAGRASHVAFSEEYRVVAESLPSRGWPGAFEDRFVDMSATRGRALHREFWLRHTGWKGFFDPGARSTALVIEAGYGSVAISLADDFDSVHVIVRDESQASVVRARAQSLGATNVTVEPFTGTPIPPRTFDAIAIHGFSAPETAAVLRAWTRNLRLSLRGGAFVAFDAGGRLGDRIATAAVARSLRRRFARVERFEFEGNLTTSAELIPAGEKTLRWRAAALVTPWRQRGIGFAAKATAAARGLFERVHARVDGRCSELWGEAAALQCRRRLFSTPEGAALVLASASDDRRQVIARIALNDRTAVRFRSNFAALEKLSRELHRTDTPSPVCAELVEGTPVFVETVLDGQPLRSHLTRERTDALDAAIGWLRQLHSSTAVSRELRAEDVAALVTEPVEAAFRFIGRGPDDPDCATVSRNLAAALRGQTLPLVFGHGDYSVDNIRVSPGGSRVTGVFDWDLAAERALPLLDVYYLLVSAELAVAGGTFANRIVDAMKGRLWNEAIERSIADYCGALGISPSLRGPLLVLTWVFHLARRIQSQEPYRWPFVEAECAGPVLPVLRQWSRESVTVPRRGAA